MIGFLLLLINMSKEPQDVTVNTEAFADDYADFDGNLVILESSYSRTLNPWQFVILTDLD